MASPLALVLSREKTSQSRLNNYNEASQNEPKKRDVVDPRRAHGEMEATNALTPAASTKCLHETAATSM